MSLHINGRKVKEAWYGGRKIKEAWYGGKKVFSAYPEWVSGTRYQIGDVVTYQGALYMWAPSIGLPAGAADWTTPPPQNTKWRKLD